MENKEIIVKSNHLIEAKYKLSMREQKIILYLISKIEKNDDDLKLYRISVKNFNEMMGLKGSPKYAEIREITTELLKKVLEVKQGKTIYSFHWLSLVAYNEQEGTIDMRFDPILKPYLMDLKRDFTKLNLKHILLLKSGNSIRIYELLKQYLNIRERTIKITDLKLFLGLDKNGYQMYSDFKRKVIVPSMKEINEKTDISFDFKEIKDGRKVISLRFFIQSKNVENQEIVSIEEALDDPLFHELKMILDKKGCNLPDKIYKNWLDAAYKIWNEASAEELILLVKDSVKKTAIQNHLAFITYILTEKVTYIQSGKDPRQITVQDNYKHTIRSEQLPSWFVEHKENEQQELSFEEDPDFLKEKAKLEADLKMRKEKVN
ncbi:replication initiation protein [Domibacillus sp. A3M-37]|uniref:replication initiation protein n=1 Tax=Domibacillus sp. A3M-37 TaxID=2962037 RepID=UPI0020B867E4|nr:replication initiation protein [Domibacillus sp. A3M-37]MCP3764688.1 replication initiation protein [Domibacillus sp. A3M-37]